MKAGEIHLMKREDRGRGNGVVYFDITGRLSEQDAKERALGLVSVGSADDILIVKVIAVAKRSARLED